MLTLMLALASHPVPVDEWDGLRSAVVALGDVDGDGVGDFALAHRPCTRTIYRPTEAWPVIPHEPIVWVLSGADGALLRTFRGTNAFGSELVAIGDIDGDGVIDLAVSDGSGCDGSNTVTLLSVGTGETLARFANPAGVRGFGRGLAGGEQLVGDDTPDLLIGAKGCAWIVDGASLRPVQALVPVAACRIRRLPVAGWVVPEAPGEQASPGLGRNRQGLARAAFGANVALLPDIDGDTLAEVVVSGAADAFCDVVVAQAEPETGNVARILFSGGELPLLALDSAAWCVVGGHDLDCDGVRDLVTTSVNLRVRAWSVGRRSLLWELDFGGGPSHAEGTSLTFTSDYDRDGIADLLLTANETSSDHDLGFVSIRSGRTGRDLLTWTVDFDLEPPPPGQLYGGLDACPIGDIDGDGLQEIAVQLPVLRLVRVLKGADLSVLWSIDTESLWR